MDVEVDSEASVDGFTENEATLDVNAMAATLDDVDSIGVELKESCATVEIGTIVPAPLGTTS